MVNRRNRLRLSGEGISVWNRFRFTLDWRRCNRDTRRIEPGLVLLILLLLLLLLRGCDELIENDIDFVFVLSLWNSCSELFAHVLRLGLRAAIAGDLLWVGVADLSPLRVM